MITLSNSVLLLSTMFFLAIEYKQNTWPHLPLVVMCCIRATPKRLKVILNLLSKLFEPMLHAHPIHEVHIYHKSSFATLIIKREGQPTSVLRHSIFEGWLGVYRVASLSLNPWAIEIWLLGIVCGKRMQLCSKNLES